MLHNLKNYLRLNRIGITCILIAWLVFFSRILFGGQLYFLDDLKIIYYPLEYAYAQFQNNWELPVWSNEFGFGQPLIAWGQLGFFAPLHILLRILHLHPIVLLNVSIAAYFLIGLIGMYVYLSARKYSQYASAMGSSVFIFNGFVIGHLNHVNFFTSTLLLPFLLLSVHQLIKKPSLPKSLVVSVISAAITLSGQPQVIILTFTIALIVSLCTFISETYGHKNRLRYSLYVITLTLVAAVIGAGLSSFALLPLSEFLPLTDRAAGLDPQVLYEFSYPPWHAITLIFPYFFGTHDAYWGAKGFQELAAFTGIIPLLAAGFALSCWRKNRSDRIAAIVLFVISICIALGKYSPFYTYLVEHHIISSLSVPGRFVFFFVVSIALLAAQGIDDLRRNMQPGRLAATGIISSLLFTAFIFLPFFIYAPLNYRIAERLVEAFQLNNVMFDVAFGSIVAWTVLLLFAPARRRYFRTPSLIALCILSLATSVFYSWGYNPITPSSQVLVEPPFQNALESFTTVRHVPPRLYTRDNLLTRARDVHAITSDRISPTFSLYQPLDISPDDPMCFTFPASAQVSHLSFINVGIHSDVYSRPLSSSTVLVSGTESYAEKVVCFSGIPDTYRQMYISFTSSNDSGVTLHVYKTPGVFSAYLIRVPHPTHKQITQSLKQVRVDVKQVMDRSIDEDLILLPRHVNAAVGASSARWIGALSIQPYREFIEKFFANDGVAIDGEGVHVLSRNRDIFNLAGVTHFIHRVDDMLGDGMEEAGFILVDEFDHAGQKYRLYQNPAAYPKAFLVPSGTWQPGADETIYRLREEHIDPFQVALLDGPIPPVHIPNNSTLSSAHARIVRYENTQVDVEVHTDRDTILVLSDAWTPQWFTYIDETPSYQLSAFAVFRAAIVPAGSHTVSFRYESKAIVYSKKITVASIAALFVLGLFSIGSYRTKVNVLPAKGSKRLSY